MRISLSIGVAAGLCTVSILPSSGLAGVPITQTFKPAGLALSFVLPSDWGKDYPDTGSKFQVNAPGRVAELHILTFPANSAVTLTQAAANIVAFERTRLAKLKSSVSSKITTIDSTPAVLVSTRWAGSVVAQDGYANVASAAGTTYEFYYLFLHDGSLCIFEYSTTADWLQREKPSFERSVKSIRFAQIA